MRTGDVPAHLSRPAEVAWNADRLGCFPRLAPLPSPRLWWNQRCSATWLATLVGSHQPCQICSPGLGLMVFWDYDRTSVSLSPHQSLLQQRLPPSKKKTSPLSQVENWLVDSSSLRPIHHLSYFQHSPRNSRLVICSRVCFCFCLRLRSFRRPVSVSHLVVRGGAFKNSFSSEFPEFGCHSFNLHRGILLFLSGLLLRFLPQLACRTPFLSLAPSPDRPPSPAFCRLSRFCASIIPVCCSVRHFQRFLIVLAAHDRFQRSRLGLWPRAF